MSSMLFGAHLLGVVSLSLQISHYHGKRFCLGILKGLSQTCLGATLSFVYVSAAIFRSSSFGTKLTVEVKEEVVKTTFGGDLEGDIICLLSV